MSYDLYFYKRKDTHVTQFEIEKYLVVKMGLEQEADTLNYYNEETGVYFYFEKLSASDEDDDFEEEEDESFAAQMAAFENLNFSFGINFLRPSFFGLEAFAFVETMIQDLNLYVMNPQSAESLPYKPTKEELFTNWNNTNVGVSAQHFEEGETAYLSVDVANNVWHHNYHRKAYQAQLGSDYFVPKIFLFVTKAERKVVTVATWTQHIPNVFPTADYYLLYGLRRRWLFKKETYSTCIDRATLLSHFGQYLEDYPIKGCKILHPKNADKTKAAFFSVIPSFDIDGIAEGIEMERLYMREEQRYHQ